MTVELSTVGGGSLPRPWLMREHAAFRHWWHTSISSQPGSREDSFGSTPMPPLPLVLIFPHTIPPTHSVFVFSSRTPHYVAPALAATGGSRLW